MDWRQNGPCGTDDEAVCTIQIYCTYLKNSSQHTLTKHPLPALASVCEWNYSRPIRTLPSSSGHTIAAVLVCGLISLDVLGVYRKNQHAHHRHVCGEGIRGWRTHTTAETHAVRMIGRGEGEVVPIPRRTCESFDESEWIWIKGWLCQVGIVNAHVLRLVATVHLISPLTFCALASSVGVLMPIYVR